MILSPLSPPSPHKNQRLQKAILIAITLYPLVSTVPTWIKVGVKQILDTPCFF
jgi:hypothetical protein